MSERNFQVKAVWAEHIGDSHFVVTDSESGGTWELPWREVFPSEIPASDRDMTIYIEFPVDPEEAKARQSAIDLARTVYGKLNDEVSNARAITRVDPNMPPYFAPGITSARVARGTKTMKEMREME